MAAKKGNLSNVQSLPMKGRRSPLHDTTQCRRTMTAPRNMKSLTFQ